MISVEYDGKYYLRLTGHAGADVRGKDIICASASILLYTLVESLTKAEEMLECPAEYSLEYGEGVVRCKPKEEYESKIDSIYEVIICGLKLLADNYPQNLIFTNYMAREI